MLLPQVPATFGLSVLQVSQELRSLLRHLIPELILSQKRHIHMGPIRNGSGVMSFKVQ